METQKKGLTIKDLVTTGIFVALLTVAMQIGGIPFGINPATTFYIPIGAAIFAGPVYLLLIAKVTKPGSLTITGILLGILYFVLGMHWAMDLDLVIGGILADIIAGVKKYRSSTLNIVAYAVQCLGFTGSYIVNAINPTAWAASMLESGGATESYLETMASAYSPMTMVIMFAGTIIVAGLSGLAGKKLLKKQFEKAGITA